MGLALPLLAVPIAVAGCAALLWFARRRPRGWRGAFVGLGASASVLLACLGGWRLAARLGTTGTYVCVDCGRTESQERLASLVCGRERIADGRDYVQRFAPELGADHEQDWHLESCLFR